DFQTQFEDYAACSNTENSKPGVKAALELLNSEHTESGQTYYSALVGHLRELGLDEAGQGYAAGSFIHAFSDGRVGRMLKVVPFFTSKEVQGGTVAQPLVELVAPLMDQARAKLTALEQWGAGVLARADIPAIIKHADVLWYTTPPAQPAPLDPPFDV